MSTVLLIDADRDVRAALQQSFHEAGFWFAAVQDGARATEAARYLLPSVILLDVVLPGPDGFEVYGRLRSVKELATTPIIFLSALDDDDLAVKALEEGAYDFVAKPFNPAVLVAKVRSLLGREQQRQLISPYQLQPGMTFADRYQIVQQLGRGSMGVVFLAHQVTLGTPFALKALSVHGQDPVVIGKRFQQEAQALARIRHPNVIQVFDAGWYGHIPYLVMSYVEGGTLADAIAESGRLPARRALEVAIGVADGMQHAHDHKILHRDLKSANILLDASGRPIVTDFGLMLLDHQEAERLTTDGLVSGTPHYMSPEQIRTPLDIDARSDVYAIGVLLYEMLTGQTPFHGLSAMDAMTCIMSQEPLPPRALAPELTPLVQQCCMGALQLDRGRRFQSAAELATAARSALAALS